MAFAEIARRIDDREFSRWKGVLKIVLSMVFCVFTVMNLQSGNRPFACGIVAMWLLLDGTFAVIRPRVEVPAEP